MKLSGNRNEHTWNGLLAKTIFWKPTISEKLSVTRSKASGLTTLPCMSNDAIFLHRYVAFTYQHVPFLYSSQQLLSNVHKISYRGRMLKSRPSALTFSAFSSAVRSATMSSRCSVYCSNILIILSARPPFFSLHTHHTSFTILWFLF